MDEDETTVPPTDHRSRPGTPAAPSTAEVDARPGRRLLRGRARTVEVPPAPRHAADVLRVPGTEAPGGVATRNRDADAPERGPREATGSGVRTMVSRLRSRFAAAPTSDDDARAPVPVDATVAAPSRPRPRPGPRPDAAAPARESADDRPRPRPRPGPPASAPAADEPAVDEPAADGPAKAPPPATAGQDDDDIARDAPPRPPLREQLRASRIGRSLTKLVILAAVVVVSALLLRTYVVAPYYIPSQSMEPTLHGCPGCNNDHVLVDKLSYRFHHPHAGDIVVFDKPPNLALPDPVLIKRVVGVGGEELVLKHGDVYVNGQRVSEPYLNKACHANPSRAEIPGRTHWLIPNDDVFVMGDNRCDSTDSRTFGPIPDSSIVGRAFVIVWPLKRFTFL